MARLTQTILRHEYPKLGKLVLHRHNIGKPLLQKDYGGDLDCTITSLAYIFGANRYCEIENIAVKYGYNADKRGTNPLTVKSIMRRLGAKNPQSRYIKGVGWTFNTIKGIVDKGVPIVLNLWEDGRGYYKNHSVTVVGYETYDSGEKFLIVYDNWNDVPCLIDYNKLSAISSLNWC